MIAIYMIHRTRHLSSYYNMVHYMFFPVMCSLKMTVHRLLILTAWWCFVSLRSCTSKMFSSYCISDVQFVVWYSAVFQSSHSCWDSQLRRVEFRCLYIAIILLHFSTAWRLLFLILHLLNWFTADSVLNWNCDVRSITRVILPTLHIWCLLMSWCRETFHAIVDVSCFYNAIHIVCYCVWCYWCWWHVKVLHVPLTVMPLMLNLGYHVC